MTTADLLLEHIRSAELALSRVRAAHTSIGMLGNLPGNRERLQQLRAVELELQTVLVDLRAELRMHRVTA